MSKTAIIVEDDAQQIYFTKGILAEYGFDVISFSCAQEARAGISSVKRPVDLAILDRKLPDNEDDEPDDDVGDALLGELLVHLPDTAFVVFTGFTGLHHHQFATRERGVINIGASCFDRVYSFEKEQAVEFYDHVGRIANEIDSLDDLEINGSVLDNQDGLAISNRLLKMVAQYYGGDSVTVRALTDGLTEFPVWQCKVVNAAGYELASVVVKQTDGSKATPPSGLHTLLPAAVVAAPVAMVSGLCDGKCAQIMQVAGSAPKSLLQLLQENQQEAATQLAAIIGSMDALPPGGFRTITLRELVEPLISWPKLVELAEIHGFPVPRPGKRASTQVVAQHGDLHPGNILEAGGNPVLIDFDNEVLASRCLDPITVLLSPLFHPSSHVRHSVWPNPDQCAVIDSAEFLDGSPCSEWMAEAQRWVEQTATSQGERWGLILAYAARQLKYKDVLDDPAVKQRALALARRAAAALGAS